MATRPLTVTQIENLLTLDTCTRANKSVAGGQYRSLEKRGLARSVLVHGGRTRLFATTPYGAERATAIRAHRARVAAVSSL